jgi:hypothetical protein
MNSGRGDKVWGGGLLKLQDFEIYNRSDPFIYP